MPLDFSKCQNYVRITDPNTRVSLIITAGYQQVPYTVAQSAKILVTDYFIELPKDKLTIFDNNPNVETTPEGGIIYISRDVPETGGHNLSFVFEQLKKNGCGIS